MKLLVLSDSHTEIMAMRVIVEREAPDMAIHLGDHIRDALSLQNRFPELPLRTVRGNCDYGVNGADEDIVDVCGCKIFITHGHLYGVKNGLGAIARKGASLGASLVLFGHTHRAYIAQSGTVRLMNPGAIEGRGRDRTYGIVLLREDDIRCEIRAPQGAGGCHRHFPDGGALIL